MRYCVGMPLQGMQCAAHSSLSHSAADGTHREHVSHAQQFLCKAHVSHAVGKLRRCLYPSAIETFHPDIELAIVEN